MYQRWEIRRIVKRDAKKAMKVNFWQTIFVFIIYYVVALVVAPQIIGNSTIFPLSIITFVLGIVITAPLYMGIKWWCLQTVRYRKVEIWDLFRYYTKSRLMTAIITIGFFQILQYVLTIIFGFIIFFSGIIIGFALNIFMMRPGIPFILNNMHLFPTRIIDIILNEHFFTIVLLFVLACACVVFVILLAQIFLIRYYCAINLMIDDHLCEFSTALDKSRRIMQGKTLDMIIFYISLWGYYLLIPLTFGLILLYILPYKECAQALYLEYFRDTYNKNYSNI